MLVDDERKDVSPMVDKHINIISFVTHFYSVYASKIRQEYQLINTAPIKLTDAVYHIMITHRNYMHSRFDDVPGTSCSYMINHGRGLQNDPGWLFDELIEAEQLIQTTHMSRIIVNGLISLF